MRAKKSAFTLVEILIVVVILGILAAIVVPQFTDASEQAKEASVRSDLQTIRSQIELYKAQHTAGALPGDGTATFTQAMTGKTDAAGAVAAAGAYGPYMRTIPTNPYNDSAAIDEAAIDGVGDGTEGWHFNNVSGNFQADDSLAHSAW